MRTNTTHKAWARVAAAAALSLGTIALTSGTTGALNFRSADNISGHIVPASADHPATGRPVWVRHVRGLHFHTAAATTSVGSNAAGGRLTYR